MSKQYSSRHLNEKGLALLWNRGKKRTKHHRKRKEGAINKDETERGIAWERIKQREFKSKFIRGENETGNI